MSSIPSSTVHTEPLAVRNITIAQRDQVLLRDLSFTVQPGETLAVMGPSGVGKSTLLRVLANTMQPREGEVDRPEGRIGMVFQDHRLLPWRNARANVMLTAVQTPSVLFDAEEWLDAVGLQDAYTLFPHQLSGGMKQRVSIARALAHQPTMLLVDEPFSALDQAIAKELRELLTELIARLNVVTVWVTHNPKEAEYVATNILTCTGENGGWELVSNK